jgi:hypothetical protein
MSCAAVLKSLKLDFSAVRQVKTLEAETVRRYVRGREDSRGG